MIRLRRSGSDFYIGSGDIGHLHATATDALARGETVELSIDSGDWLQVASPAEANVVLHELYEELDARRDLYLSGQQLPIEGLL